MSCFPLLWVADSTFFPSERGKLYLCDDETVVVTKAHVDKVVGRLDSEGRFGHDNRAGVPGQLHRVSVMRSREVK